MNLKANLLLAVLLTFILSLNSLAEVPSLINYQGKLTDSEGENYPDGNYSLSFAICSTATGESTVWSESQMVNVSGGIFHLLLGTVSPINAAHFSNSERWLEVTVEGNTVAPRTRFTSVPYALVLSDESQLWNLADSIIYTNGHFGISRGECENLNTGDSIHMTINLGVACTTQTAPDFWIIYPMGGNTISGGYLNVACSSSATVSGGSRNRALNHGSTVSGGDLNVAEGLTSAIGGGTFNSIGPWGSFSSIGGGVENTTDSDYCAISGGYQNSAQGDYSAIGGGENNQTNGEHSAIGGGRNNIATGEQSAISGGSGNQALGQGSFIGGGFGHEALGSNNTISGGVNNNTDSVNATIGGGSDNTAIGRSATVAGGRNNIAESDWGATIGGGESNEARGFWATVAGGRDNNASGSYSSIQGGYANSAVSGSSVGGGAENNAEGSYSAISCGKENTASGGYSSIGGGLQNSALGQYAAVPGGYFNVAGGDYSFAAGFLAKANHDGSIVISGSPYVSLSDSVQSGGDGQMVLRANGGIYLTNTAELAPYDNTNIITTRGGAYLSGNGTDWTNSCDRNIKENFRDVNTNELLEKLGQLEISFWNYREDDPSLIHIGPMAQDFYSSFGLGADDKHISTVDADGVALAAIQALIEINTKQTDKIELLSKELDQLRKLVGELLVESGRTPAGQSGYTIIEN